MKNGNVKIVSLLLYNELLIPIKPEYMSEKDIKKLGLSIKFQPLEIDINKEILKNKVDTSLNNSIKIIFCFNSITSGSF